MTPLVRCTTLLSTLEQLESMPIDELFFQRAHHAKNQAACIRIVLGKKCTEKIYESILNEIYRKYEHLSARIQSEMCTLGNKIQEYDRKKIPISKYKSEWIR